MTCRKSRPLRHSFARPGLWRIVVFLDHRAEGERYLWLATRTAQICTVLLASVDRRTLQCVWRTCSFPLHAHTFMFHVPSPLVFRLPRSHLAHDDSREHIPLSGAGSSLNASKDVGMGVTDLALVCGSEPVMDAGNTAVVGSACPCVFEAGSDCEDRSSDVCYVGDTLWSFSVKKHHLALVISAESCHIATCLCLERIEMKISRSHPPPPALVNVLSHTQCKPAAHLFPRIN